MSDEDSRDDSRRELLPSGLRGFRARKLSSRPTSKPAARSPQNAQDGPSGDMVGEELPDLEGLPDASPTAKKTVTLPVYLTTAIREAATTRGVSDKFVILDALAKAGFEILPQDLVPDRRATRKRSKKNKPGRKPSTTDPKTP